MNAPLALTPDTALTIDRTCLCLNVQRAARAIGRRYDAALRPVGLSNWQFTLLVMLSREEPPTISTLAHDLAMDRTTVTANLKPLERRGLLAIAVDAQDRRVRRAALTGTGRALLDDALPLWQAAQAAASERLGENERTALLAAMKAVSA
ncbi:MarR family winged helix-turn-helix transcriptional regulator [Methylobacterium planeticum]|uniref:Winged helix-turn-helix transcriptional regulator n=1 Tax=Methylobacterium planeticum TaxID=2615211 RepID=A0A6N6MQ91_9HYPH|nr:MarR family winged helix-turn-helix transcriptional regulator [Methylobacterium planeticum]KAB1072277.1 winged helix-turn-helix transcriptional regulator [Methylobacterium planeticum]